MMLAIVWATACAPDRSVPDAAAESPSTAGTANEWFSERAEESGLDFVHFNGATGAFYYPEILPPGVALFDYDNDGDLDVYLVQGRMLDDGKGPGDGVIPPHIPRGGRLFRNDLQIRQDGTRTLRFVDVTGGSGISANQYGLGVAAGDIDNDGWVDLLLTNFGVNQLFRNNGNGTFSDVSKESGIQDHSGRFGVSAAFVDYDRDGWLDLYVGNNVNYTLKNPQQCPNMAGARDYCPPQVYGGQPDRLYRNRGRGRFVDVTGAALIGAKFGPALGIATADYNNDGWIDIYVANDGEENLLWINQKNGTLREMALLSGAALTAEGKAEASMGVDAGDFDNDGDDDLFMTELTGQGANLYVNDGSGRFKDSSAASGLGSASLPYTGWGTAWFDYDNDGWLDILTVNGTIVAAEGRGSQPFPYDQPKLLFHNLGNGRFEDVTSRGGAALSLSESGRGAAFGDIDNDGDQDVLIGNDSGRVRLLVNGIGIRNHWLGLRLLGRENRDMLGALVTVTKSDGSKLRRRARADGSYGSANDPRVLVGLGSSTDEPRVQVQWPGGAVEDYPDLRIDTWTTLQEGGGR
jgi:hypothetical protein